MRKNLSIIILIALFLSSCIENKKEPADIELVSTDNSNYFDSIYQSEALIVTQDQQMLAIIDSLLSTDPKRELYHFIVFTKSMNGADGFYSEAVGMAAMEYLIAKPDQFIKNFSSTTKINDSDLKNWANMIAGEIMISRENEEHLAFIDLKQKLLSEEKEWNNSELELLNELFDEIKSTLPQQRVIHNSPQ